MDLFVKELNAHTGDISEEFLKELLLLSAKSADSFASFEMIVAYLVEEANKTTFRRVPVTGEILRILSNYFDFDVANRIKEESKLFLIDKEKILNFLSEDARGFIFPYTKIMSILGIVPSPEIVVKYAQDLTSLGPVRDEDISPSTFYFNQQESSWYKKVLKMIMENPGFDSIGISCIFVNAPYRIKKRYQKWHKSKK